MTNAQISERSLQLAHAEAARLADARRRYTLSVRITQIVLIVIVLCFWQFGGGGIFDPFYVGSPSGVWDVLKHDLADPQFYRDLMITAIEMAAGYCIGSSLGILTGALLARWKFVADVADPAFVALNSIPRIALAPLIIIWFGIDLSSKIVLAATLVYFMTFFSTLSGIRGVDEAVVNVARVMGATPWHIFLKVQLPGARVWIANGLRLSLPFALIGVIVGEFLAASEGLGYRLNMYSTSYKPNGVFAMLIIMMIFMIILNSLIGWLEFKAVGKRKTQAPADGDITP
ncbi:ABC transporter permease [Tardiphaga sp. 866_E4_N2_1]|uniref:ABC transporter permease n=1 Tax=unclassified Tardiphaga TaxID=2631404 RepID=UPI003F1E7874